MHAHFGVRHLKRREGIYMLGHREQDVVQTWVDTSVCGGIRNEQTPEDPKASRNSDNFMRFLRF
jgi:hypothetical protein